MREAESLVPTMALAAEAALLNLRAFMTAAPRCCTVVMNSPESHSESVTTDVMGLPPTEPCETSGYCVDEWLPQMMTFLTSST